jgi:hypothetical protein
MPAVHAGSSEPAGGSSLLRLGIGVFVVALGLRLVFGRLIAGTYDYDEFVLLLLARDFAHGATPYRDFMFFHPPGALALLRGIEPLTALWWPLARIASSAIDSATAAMVFFVGSRMFDRRTGVAAGLVYAASPLALVSSVRVGQDPLITAIGMLGITALVVGPEKRRAVLAGVCLGLAVWVKYPALYFAPVYLLLSPRRFVVVAAVGVCTFGLLLVPFLGQWHALYTQTVSFQHTRWMMPLTQRLATTALFWIALNALALPGLWRRAPAWLVAGFGLGGLFLFVPQVYYHYFVPVVPFAALLAGVTVANRTGDAWTRTPYPSPSPETQWRGNRIEALDLGETSPGNPSAIRSVSRIPGWRSVPVLAAMLIPMLLAAAVIDAGGYSPLYVTAARFSDVEPTVKLLDSDSTSNEAVLADRFEYAYLAHRPALAHYFWNVGVLVNTEYLERRVNRARAVVVSSGASSGYPIGFTSYLNQHYRHVNKPTTTVWLLPRRNPKH